MIEREQVGAEHWTSSAVLITSIDVKAALPCQEDCEILHFAVDVAVILFRCRLTPKILDDDTKSACLWSS